nr:52 kDa repressor of the inhibitor of the protein kinase-like [Hydra vulgaris]
MADKEKEELMQLFLNGSTKNEFHLKTSLHCNTDNYGLILRVSILNKICKVLSMQFSVSQPFRAESDFQPVSHNARKLAHLYKSPFVAYSKAIKKFNKHAEISSIHQTATLKATHFRQCMEQKINFIDLNLNKVIDVQIEKNREILKPIVLAIVMCGKQNIPLRVHRVDSFYYENENSNSGNLQSILKLIFDCAENSLVNRRIATPKNATYRSKTTQNELINICNDIIVSKLKCRVKKAKFFSILAEEASDVSNMEQMPLVLRFVNDNCGICELFFGFIPCNSGLSGEAIASQILNSIKDLGLEMKFCVGQGYDGAGNMAGICSGAAVRKKLFIQKHCMFIVDLMSSIFVLQMP